MANRKNAMLTSEDRRWLSGEKTYDGKHAKQQRYQRRRDIRERVYNSILDFSLLFDHLDEAEREDIFGGTTSDGRVWQLEDEPLREGITDGLAFLLSTVGVAAFMREPDDDPGSTVAEQVLFDALYRAGQKEGVLVEAMELDVTTSQVSIPDLLDDLETDEELSSAALRLLIESGVVEKERVQDCIRDLVLEKEALARDQDLHETETSVGQE